MINLDDNRFDFKATELAKLCKTHTVSDKRFIQNLVKNVLSQDHGVPKQAQYCWDSIPMHDGQMLNSLDFIDSLIRVEFYNYFEELLTRISFRRRIIRKEMEVYVSDADEGDEEEEKEEFKDEEWDVISDPRSSEKETEDPNSVEETTDKIVIQRMSGLGTPDKSPKSKRKPAPQPKEKEETK